MKRAWSITAGIAAALALADYAYVLVNGSIRFAGPTQGTDFTSVLHAAYLGTA